MSNFGIGENLETIRNLLNIEAPVGNEDSLEEDVLNHNLWGIHIKEENDALSEENPHVCIGWSKLGDLSELETTQDIMEVYEQHFNKSNRAKGQDVGMIRRFLRELQIGDYIIFAEATEFHIGRIESDKTGLDRTRTSDHSRRYFKNHTQRLCALPVRSGCFCPACPWNRCHHTSDSRASRRDKRYDACIRLPYRQTSDTGCKATAPPRFKRHRSWHHL